MQESGASQAPLIWSPLTHTHTHQGVTELQRVGLDSPSDSEIRIAAYRGLVHCLPSQPDLIQTVAKALDPSHDDFSTQGQLYIVISSTEFLLVAEIIKLLPVF